MESMSHIFSAKPKKWGNSIGIVIPKEIIKSEKINLKKTLTLVIFPTDNSDLKETFGTLKKPKGKTTQEIMEEIDKGHEHDW